MIAKVKRLQRWWRSALKRALWKFWIQHRAIIQVCVPGAAELSLRPSLFLGPPASFDGDVLMFPEPSDPRAPRLPFPSPFPPPPNTHASTPHQSILSKRARAAQSVYKGFEPEIARRQAAQLASAVKVRKGCAGAVGFSRQART
jgi:hypothetical protein